MGMGMVLLYLTHTLPVAILTGEGAAMTEARPRLASGHVVVARWSTILDVIFIISNVCCTAMIEDE